ncbi:MAG: methyltransferase domain-containing protein [Salinivirgaceae bacterium]|nr:methyltransferase domain-containing protein [Salinivirgaceae bacterium]MDD4747562.1 methyltransferase domain-containing protein [Salinivirgaceae bacterium]MDY0280920.1 methyltransferase domain-containing protein [Salinivirgaceae bacterium]
MQYIIQCITRFVPRHIMQRFAMFFLKIIGIFYRGNNFYDPISKTSYRKMLPYGRQVVRKNALAPNSGSLERHRVIWLYLQNETSFFEAPLKFLHIAPEFCFLKKFKKLKNLSYVTGDLESPWADVKLDVREMPFSENTFDATMCNHVFEHIDDDKKAMSEFLRVLKPGGWGIFMVPIKWDQETIEDPTITDPKERERLFGQRDHVRYYGSDYPDRLRSVGFEVTVIDYYHKLDQQLVNKYALLPDEKIIFCKKPVN